MKKKVISEMVCEIEVNEKSAIRISRTRREGENRLCVDIRMFELYPIRGHYDGERKATPHGVPIPLDDLPNVLCALYDIYEEEFGRKFDREEDGINE